jgi:hypothetical protein
VTDRRRPADQSFSQGAPAYQRLAQRIDEGHAAISDRVEAGFDRVMLKMERMERDLAAGERARENLSSDFEELRLALGELRDAAHLGADKAVRAVAEAAPAAVAPVMAKSIWTTTWGKVVALAVGFTAIVAALNSVPEAVRGWDAFWAKLRNDPPAVVRGKADD